MKIALATCRNLPEVDADEHLLVRALEQLGARIRLLAWDAQDDEANAEQGELVVLRSTWNYYKDVDRFLAWVDQTAARTRLFNPAPIVRANARKTYLRDLAARGVATVPTEYVARGESRSLAAMLETRGWEAFVIKPVVSAGSFRTKRFALSAADEAQRFLEELTSERDAMVQKWMPVVETYGERSLVWIDGTITHAIRKSPRFDADQENVSAEVPITDSERAFAESVVGPMASELLYARVDIVDDAGVLRLMEVELIEPSLFLRQSTPALERFAYAIARRAQS